MRTERGLWASLAQKCHHPQIIIITKVVALILPESCRIRVESLSIFVQLFAQESANYSTHPGFLDHDACQIAMQIR